jgi:hypothetical protein
LVEIAHFSKLLHENSMSKNMLKEPRAEPPCIATDFKKVGGLAQQLARTASKTKAIRER